MNEAPSRREAACKTPVHDRFLTLQQQHFRVSVFAGQDDERFEMGFYEDVISRDPCNEAALLLLGHAYTRSGDIQRGLEVDQRLVRLRPQDPTAFYNLACSYALLGRTDDAFEALEKAIRLGYRDLNHILNDPDLAALRSAPGFRRFVSRLLGDKAQNS